MSFEVTIPWFQFHKYAEFALFTYLLALVWFYMDQVMQVQKTNFLRAPVPSFLGTEKLGISTWLNSVNYFLNWLAITLN